MNNLEQQWAKALKQARQQTKLPVAPVQRQKKQNQEELSYFKNKLKQTLAARDFKAAEMTLKKLFKLRAGQMIIFLREKKEQDVWLEDEAYAAQLKKYFRDCAELTQSANVIIVNQHAANSTDN